MKHRVLIVLVLAAANNHHLKWWFETLCLNRSKRFGLRITC